MVLASSKVIRRLAGPHATIFNDKIKNGEWRSYKVVGSPFFWTRVAYELAARALMLEGFEVKLTRLNRLHVKVK